MYLGVSSESYVALRGVSYPGDLSIAHEGQEPRARAVLRAGQPLRMLLG
jgi:hypothetical protein